VLFTASVDLGTQGTEVREAVIHGVTVFMIYVFTFKAVTVLSELTASLVAVRTITALVWF
jgi:hypothetical protein